MPTAERLEAIDGLIAEIARGLVDHPDQVTVGHRDEAGTVVVSLLVAPDDRGQVIGRGGRVAHALRAVLRAAAPPGARRITLEIVD